MLVLRSGDVRNRTSRGQSGRFLLLPLLSPTPSVHIPLGVSCFSIAVFFPLAAVFYHSL